MTDSDPHYRKSEFIGEEQLQELGFQKIDKLGYFFRPLISWTLLEVILVFWPPGSGSQPHDHGNCLNCSLIFPVGRSKLAAELYDCSRGKLIRSWATVFTDKALHIVFPRQIHQLRQIEGISISLNFYIPMRRKS
jgi:hypothetical protein